MIRPTAHRILIQPDDQPDADGSILLPQHREFVATSGTVIAIGPRGSQVRWDARQRALRDVIAEISKYGQDRTVNLVAKMLGTPDVCHDIAVGDRVAFDSESGLRLTENGVEYLILNEDDVVVIVDERESAA